MDSNAKILKSATYLSKFWYYGRISGCKLKGTAVLDSSMVLTYNNENTLLKQKEIKEVFKVDR